MIRERVRGRAALQSRDPFAEPEICCEPEAVRQGSALWKPRWRQEIGAARKGRRGRRRRYRRRSGESERVWKGLESGNGGPGRKTGEADALAQQARALPGGARGLALGLLRLLLVGVVDEVAARAVRTEAHCVESAARLGFVLRVPVEAAQLLGAVRELALGAVLARAALLVRTAELGFVARGHGRHRRLSWGGRGDAQARGRREAGLSTHVSFDHAHGAVSPERDALEGRTRKLLPTPGLAADA